jgi:hypothetical protein
MSSLLRAKLTLSPSQGSMNSATENNRRLVSQLKYVTLEDHPNCQIYVMYKKFLVKGTVQRDGSGRN